MESYLPSLKTSCDFHPTLKIIIIFFKFLLCSLSQLNLQTEEMQVTFTPPPFLFSSVFNLLLFFSTQTHRQFCPSPFNLCFLFEILSKLRVTHFYIGLCVLFYL